MTPADASGLLEARLADAGFDRVAGVDEVGRGALAGPLFAGAVILPPDVHIDGLRDSKLCTRRQRESLAEQIKEVAIAWSVVRIRHDRIDRFGLQRCNLQALRRALKKLTVPPEYVLIDGFRIKRLTIPGLAVKKADTVSKNVAAASIVAKVARDRSMRRYHRRYPQYGFRTNVGYGTAEHWAALKAYGPCDIHRRSFYGVTGFSDLAAADSPPEARHLQEQVVTDDDEFDEEIEEDMSVEDLEKYEAEMELQLYKEYRDVLPMFKYVVETERRFYLANEVNVDTRHEGPKVWFEVELNDAWVWDMHRPARFVSHVKVVTFRDLNVEELAQLAERDLLPEPPGMEH